jgi:hypothetical protein
MRVTIFPIELAPRLNDWSFPLAHRCFVFTQASGQTQTRGSTSKIATKNFFMTPAPNLRNSGRKYRLLEFN